MRQVFEECKTRKTAQNRNPWASYVVKCHGGYKLFESYDDYRLFVDGQENKKHYVKH